MVSAVGLHILDPPTDRWLKLGLKQCEELRVAELVSGISCSSVGLLGSGNVSEGACDWNWVDFNSCGLTAGDWDMLQIYPNKAQETSDFNYLMKVLETTLEVANAQLNRDSHLTVHHQDMKSTCRDQRLGDRG
jgi:hypothetical protein